MKRYNDGRGHYRQAVQSKLRENNGMPLASFLLRLTLSIYGM